MRAKKQNNDTIELDHGGGGYKSWELIEEIRGNMADSRRLAKKWQNCEDDAAVYNLGKQKLVFTTDAFIIDPIFFPSGDIGKIAACGTINDLAVMGAKPIGLSLSIVIEEGFSKKDLLKIIRSINNVSKESGVPIVTGDTKVTEKGKLDKIEITTAGVGLAGKIIENKGIETGDLIIASGDLGEHGIALLSQRFNCKSKIKSDCKPLNKEIESVASYLHSCKDPTRGGLAANLYEMAEKSGARIILEEKKLPYKKEAFALAELLGIDIFSLPSEGRFIAAVSEGDAEKTLKILKKNNPEAKIIGRAEKASNKNSGVFLKTSIGGIREIEMPRGKLIPRIC